MKPVDALWNLFTNKLPAFMAGVVCWIMAVHLGHAGWFVLFFVFYCVIQFVFDVKEKQLYGKEE